MPDPAPTANRWTWLTSLTPTIDSAVKAGMALAWMLVGAGSLAGYQAVNPAFRPPVFVTPAADGPKPVASSLASSPELTEVIGEIWRLKAKAEILESKLDQALSRLPEKPAEATKAKAARKATAREKAQTLAGELKKLDPLAK